MVAAVARSVSPAPDPRAAKLQQMLQTIFLRQYSEVISKHRRGIPTKAPSLDHWTQPMVDWLAPLVFPYFVHGGRDATAKINASLYEIAQRTGRGIGQAVDVLSRTRHGNATLYARRLKDTNNKPIPSVLFNQLHPRVREAVNRLTFDFCDATNATTSERLEVAYAKTRQAIGEGLAHGDAYTQMGLEVGKIFQDPMRAYVIAHTEGNRAIHAGGQMAARESGVVKGKRWMARSDACEKVCLPLMARGVIALDQPYRTDAGKGIYAIVMHPPAHPRCLLPSTLVDAPGRLGVYRAEYDGPTVTIWTASNSGEEESFTCTPNHILLTAMGFRKTGSLRSGDILFSLPELLGNPQPIGTIIEAEFRRDILTASIKTVGGQELHGDGVACSEVLYGSLRGDSLHGLRGVLDFALTTLVGELDAGDKAARERAASLRYPQSFALPKSAENFTARRVVQVTPGHYIGPVFDLMTASSLYLIGRHGIISSNCTCTESYEVDSDLSAFRKPPPIAAPGPQIVYPERQPREEVSQTIRHVLHPDATGHDVAKLVGATDNSVVHVSRIAPNVVEAKIEDVDFMALRRLIREELGLVCENIHSRVNVPSLGTGMQMLARQVEALVQEGAIEIRCEAVRGPGLNGYYTWPRLGFDAVIPDEYLNELPPELDGCETLLDLFCSDGGPEWWLRHGGTVNVTFDLSPGSESRRVLKAYQRAKGRQPRAAPAPLTKAKRKRRQQAEEIDLNPSEEAALDEVWATFQARGGIQ